MDPHTLFIPTLSHWEYGNEWSGERGQARFLITPVDGVLQAELWRGPLCRDCSEIWNTAQFPVCAEGLEQMTAWLLEQAELLNRQP